MPEQETLRRAHEDEREGKAPTTQAGEFIREEMHHPVTEANISLSANG